MNLAYRMQKTQDWITQQWVILFGQKINPLTDDWLIGPFGELNGIGADFIHELAEKENLIVVKNQQNCGLIPNFKSLKLPENQLEKISPKIIDFYENTSNYNLDLKINWNPIFKPFGYLLQLLFSKRLKQLYIPTKNIAKNDPIDSQIILLLDQKTHEIIYRFWLRTTKKTKTVIYSGIYGITQLPSKTIAIKAVFPLPKGNATVLLQPIVTNQGELILRSAGKQYGDAGFYFLLNDSKNHSWAKYISTFRDELKVFVENEQLKAEQQLKIWGLNVVKFSYLLTIKT